MKIFNEPYCVVSEIAECTLFDYIVTYGIQILIIGVLFMIATVFVIASIGLIYRVFFEER